MTLIWPIWPLTSLEWWNDADILGGIVASSKEKWRFFSGSCRIQPEWFKESTLLHGTIWQKNRSTTVVPLRFFFGGRGFTTEKTFWQADMERLAHSPCQLIQVWTDLKSLGWRYLEHVGTSGLPALGIVDYHGLSLPGMIFLYWRLNGGPLPHLKVWGCLKMRGCLKIG